MNKWLLLLIVAGLAWAGWLNQDKVKDFLQKKGVAQMIGMATPEPMATPHPAAEARLQATQAYPALAIQGSAFNIKFLQLYNEVKQTDPNFLAQPDWPLQLAERTATALGGGAMPVAMATPVAPVHLQGSVLDKKTPNPGGRGAPTPVPSALDQPPVSTRVH